MEKLVRLALLVSVLLLVILLLGWSFTLGENPPGTGTNYYVDDFLGNDANPGTDPALPWKSLHMVNQTIFLPGDSLFFKSGCVWSGQLWPKGSGVEGYPIRIDLYGGDILPIIQGQGMVTDTLRLHNQQYWEIRNLEITNQGASRSVRRGVHLVTENFGTAHHIYLSRLAVHDVNGDLALKDNGGIVWRCIGDHTPSRFVDLRIENCRVSKVDRSGIVAFSSHWDRSKWFPSLGVMIRDNILDDIGGDGITPWACDGALIEYNRVGNCSSRSDSYNAGVWPWSCDNTIVQFNEVYRTHGTLDGQGFDSDYNSRSTLIQYNYSHDNEGGFLLLCNDGGQPQHVSVGNSGTVVRYNISQDDLTRIFHVAGPAKNSVIYNNTIYVGKNRDVAILLVSDWSGWAEGTHFYNNLFYVEGTGHYGHAVQRNTDGTYSMEAGLDPSVDTVLDSNWYAGVHLDRPEDLHALVGDPLLVAAGSGGIGLNSLAGYALLPGSKAIDSGLWIEDNGDKDFFGFKIPEGIQVDRGASEFQSSRDRISDRLRRHYGKIRPALVAP